MRRVRLRQRADGLREIVRADRLRRLALWVGFVSLGIPAALVLLFAMVAVLPVVVLVAPVGVLMSATACIWVIHEQRSAGARQEGARIVPLDSWR